MFSGIVQALCPIVFINKQPGLIRYGIQVEDTFSQDIRLGASVAVDGVCQTLVHHEASCLYFEAIEQTLKLTTLDQLTLGQKVNLERSLKVSDEIGGHHVAGHVDGSAQIVHCHRPNENNHILTLRPPSDLLPYLFGRGFVALDGASLTLARVDLSKGIFDVHLIPETLRATTFGFKSEGDWVNIEICPTTRAIVETTQKILTASKP